MRRRFKKGRDSLVHGIREHRRSRCISLANLNLGARRRMAFNFTSQPF
jgi:hypothetical protein